MRKRAQPKKRIVIFLSKSILHLPDLSFPFAITTDASKFASGAMLLQTDANGEWHPCLYLFQSFSFPERNYNIYDRELLAIIWALKSWRQYLHGSPISIQVFTDHKNLTYFHKAQSLNQRQAHWLLDLADFGLNIIHVPGKLLIAPDALSRCPDLLPPDDNNEDITLLPPSMFVHVIDAIVSHCITSASSNNPLVLQALQSMNEDILPAFHSHLSDWQITESVLTYKSHIYVSNNDNCYGSIIDGRWKRAKSPSK